LSRIRDSLQARGIAATPLFTPGQASRPARFFKMLRSKRRTDDRTLDDLKGAAKIADIAADQYDLILCVMASRILPHMQSTTPAVYVSDATWPLLRAEYPEHRFAGAEEDHAERASLARASAHIYSSNWARNSAVNDYGLARGDTYVIPFGANFVPEEARLAPRSINPSDQCELLFVAREWSRKRGDLAIATQRQLHELGLNVRLTIVGQDLPAGSIRAGEPIRHLGWLEIEKVAQKAAYELAFRQAHFLLLPTLADCTPIVCAEASAFGVPTLATRVGGLESMVSHGVNGILLPVEADASDYAREIFRLHTSPEEYSKLSRSARRHYEESLNWDHWASKAEPIFKKVLGTDESQR
jgi:glycosyltransferase involved in cell wall biosynthesis